LEDTMTRIIPWSPFREMVDMQRRLDRIFDDVGRNLPESDGWTETGNWLALDVHESDDAYTVKTDLPGMSPENINVSLHDNMLTISAESKQEEKRDSENKLISERRYGAFHRSIRLPNTVDADKVEASFENGVLQLTLPKSEAAKPRQIEVKNSRLLNPQR
jgi:HSP20 family protein